MSNYASREDRSYYVQFQDSDGCMIEVKASTLELVTPIESLVEPLKSAVCGVIKYAADQYADGDESRIGLRVESGLVAVSVDGEVVEEHRPEPLDARDIAMPTLVL